MRKKDDGSSRNSIFKAKNRLISHRARDTSHPRIPNWYIVAKEKTEMTTPFNIEPDDDEKIDIPDALCRIGESMAMGFFWIAAVIIIVGVVGFISLCHFT